MPPSFTITTPVPTIPANANGKAEVIFTVANTSGVPARAMAKVVPSGDTRADWLSIAGESERDFPVNGNQQFAVIARVPAGVPEGNYPFRLDMVSARKTGEERVEGPIVNVAVPARPVPPTPRSYWWIFALLALLLVGAVAAYLWSRKTPDQTPPVVTTTETTATTDTTPTDTGTTTPTFTATIVDIRVDVPNMINMPIANAEFQATQAGLTHRRRRVTDDLIPVGTVKTHTPGPGTKVLPGSEVVFDVVSPPENLVTVPDVKGMQWTKAKLVIENAGLTTVMKQQLTNPFKKGEVISQDPPPGARVPRGQKVTVIVDGMP